MRSIALQKNTSTVQVKHAAQCHACEGAARGATNEGETSEKSGWSGGVVGGGLFEVVG